MPRTFRNPILQGCYPDPSICRVGEDYYLVTSTFEYFPGLPIFHSRDLVHWQQIGHVLDRASQLPLQGVRASAGLYAPTIRYSNGVFYVINTLVDGKTKAGNFIVTATEPAGPWSEPFWLENADGIDPSLFFDEDGKCWYVGTHLKEEGYYTGHTEIYLQELDLEKMQLVSEPLFLWDGALKEVVWAESPHIYKTSGYYYLLIAEAGTAHHHAVTVARSKSIMGPYEPNRANPILTHRHLGLDYPIVGTGHADLVETQNGEWWMVCLAMRPYGGYFYNLGRETFLVPVRWEEDWPIVNPGVGKVELETSAPNLPEHTWAEIPTREKFDGPSLPLHWNSLRTPVTDFASLTERPGYLRLRLRPERITEETNPSFIGRRQQHIHFVLETAMEFTPQTAHECAGVVLRQNEDFHFRFVVTCETDPVIQLIRRSKGQDQLLASQPVRAGRCALRVLAHAQNYNFYFSIDDQWQTLIEHVDGRILSTPVAGGFVGAFIGIYASSNGQPSSNAADFDWFDYRPLPDS